jgi:hypothetical protein
LNAGGEVDESQVYMRGIGTFNGTATIPLQLLATLSAPGNATLTCRDFDVGDAKSRDISIMAIRVSD